MASTGVLRCSKHVEARYEIEFFGKARLMPACNGDAVAEVQVEACEPLFAGLEAMSVEAGINIADTNSPAPAEVQRRCVQRQKMAHKSHPKQRLDERLRTCLPLGLEIEP